MKTKERGIEVVGEAANWGVTLDGAIIYDAIETREAADAIAKVCRGRMRRKGYDETSLDWVKIEADVRAATKKAMTQLNRRPLFPFKECKHSDTKEGPRIPARWGSWPSEVCTECGGYRTLGHVVGHWRKGPPDTTEVEDS